MYPRRRSIAACVLAAVVVLTVMQNLGGVLHEMHPATGVAGSITSIDKPLVTKDDATRVVQGWVDWGKQPSECNEVCASPMVVAAWWLTFDSFFFAPLLALVLALLGRRRLGFLYPGSWIHQVLTIATWGAFLYLALDEFENLLTTWFVFHMRKSGLLAQIIGFVSLFKVVSILLVAVPIVASFPFRNEKDPNGPDATHPTAPALWPSLRALRIPAVMSVLSVAVLLGLPPGVRPQLHDVVRTWLDTNGWHPLWAFLCALAFSVALAAACRVIANRDATLDLPTDASGQPTTPDDRRFFLYTAIALIGWGAYIGAHVAKLNIAPLLLPIAVVATLVAVTDGPELVRHARRKRGATTFNDSVARTIAIAPLAALGLLILRATQFAGPLGPKSVGGGLAALALLLAVGGWRLLRAAPTGYAAPIVVLVVSGLGAVAIAVAGRYHPLGVGWALGSIAVLFTALLGGLALLAGIEHIFWNPPSAALAVIRMRRAPIFTLLIIAAVLESSVDTNAVFHAVQVRPERAASATAKGPYYQRTSGLSPSGEFRRYVGTHTAAVASTGRPVVPIFVIASSGGGGRAQFWTLLAMNCLFANNAPAGHERSEAFGCSPEGAGAAPRWDDVFVASGISGGSVGLAMYDATHREMNRAPGVDVAKVFDRGFLDPMFATMMTHDLPNAFLHLARGHDRARTLETSWEDELPAMRDDYLASQRSVKFPILMLNSADAVDGCRINVSILELALPTDSQDGSESTCRSSEPFTAGTIAGSEPIAGTRDVLDYVCSDRGDALRYSTAGLLSARFPYISPTGALERCSRTPVPGPNRPQHPRPRHTIYAVDGGYVDTTAASPLVELFGALGISPPEAGTPKAAPTPTAEENPCYQPVVLQIDNGYVDSVAPAPPGRPRELVAPIKGAQTAASARYANAEQSLAELASRPRCDGVAADLPTYLHVFPRLHPGTTAPLGWSLSKTAQADMGSQLSRAQNQLAFCNARRWLVAAERNRNCRDAALKAKTTEQPPPLGSGRDAWWIPVLAIAAALLGAGYFLRRQVGRFGAVLTAIRGGRGPTPTPPRWRRRSDMLGSGDETFHELRENLHEEQRGELDARLDLLEGAGSPRGIGPNPSKDEAAAPERSDPATSVVQMDDRTAVNVGRARGRRITTLAKGEPADSDEDPTVAE